MSEKQPNIIVSLRDNFGWEEVGCYDGGVLRGAETPRIEQLASEELRLLNYKRRSAVHFQPLGPADRTPRNPLGHEVQQEYAWLVSLGDLGDVAMTRTATG